MTKTLVDAARKKLLEAREGTDEEQLEAIENFIEAMIEKAIDEHSNYFEHKRGDYY